MLASVLAVGVDPATESFLEHDGIRVMRAPNLPREELGSATKGCNAILFGMNSRCGASTIGALREREVPEPVVCILAGKYTREWSRRCARFLRSGADDVLIGPCLPEEVSASLQACIRRAVPRRTVSTFKVDDRTLEIDLAGCRIRLDGRILSLSPYERDLLLLLAAKPGPHSKAAICENLYLLYGGDFPEDRPCDSIAIAVSRIRSRFGGTPFIGTVRTRGYELRGRVF